MKKLIFALALLVMGGASLSTASAASISPAATTISEAAQSDSALQLAGGYRHRHYGHRYHYNNYHYRKRHHGYPHGYYKGFCYDYPYHWWCKKYFYKYGY